MEASIPSFPFISSSPFPSSPPSLLSFSFSNPFSFSCRLFLSSSHLLHHYLPLPFLTLFRLSSLSLSPYPTLPLFSPPTFPNNSLLLPPSPFFLTFLRRGKEGKGSTTRSSSSLLSVFYRNPVSNFLSSLLQAKTTGRRKKEKRKKSYTGIGLAKHVFFFGGGGEMRKMEKLPTRV